MATAPDFRDYVEPLARAAVMGSSTQLSLAVGAPLSNYLTDVTPLRAGEKVFRLRVDLAVGEQEDSNQTYEFVTCQIEVLRGLHVSELVGDEALYDSDEKLYNQSNLMKRSTWIGDQTTIDSITEGPSMAEDSDRSGNIVSYTVEFTARLAFEP